MASLRVSLFCKYHVQSVDQACELSVLKAQELFSYLLLFHDRPHHREILATVLWEDVPSTQSKRYFRRALWQLQSALSSWEVEPQNNAILVDGDWIQINPQAAIWVDTNAFEQAYLRTKGIAGQRLDTNSAHELRKAVQLYRGDLLEGWYQDWCLFERERFQQIYLSMLDKLMLYSETIGEYEEGIEDGMSLLRYDKMREQTYRRLMRLYILCGNRSEALRQYEKCKSILNEELGIHPSQFTHALYEQIRTSQYEVGSTQIFDNSNLSFQPRPLLEKLYGELQQIRGLLMSIHKQVNHQIESVDSIFDGQL